MLFLAGGAPLRLLGQPAVRSGRTGNAGPARPFLSLIFLKPAASREMDAPNLRAPLTGRATRRRLAGSSAMGVTRSSPERCRGVLQPGTIHATPSLTLQNSSGGFEANRDCCWYRYHAGAALVANSLVSTRAMGKSEMKRQPAPEKFGSALARNHWEAGSVSTR